MKDSIELGQLPGEGHRRCGQCTHFLAIRPGKEVNPERRDFGGWCQKNKLTTCPELFRCGGDDFERRLR